MTRWLLWTCTDPYDPWSRWNSKSGGIHGRYKPTESKVMRGLRTGINQSNPLFQSDQCFSPVESGSCSCINLQNIGQWYHGRLIHAVTRVTWRDQQHKERWYHGRLINAVLSGIRWFAIFESAKKWLFSPVICNIWICEEVAVFSGVLVSKYVGIVCSYEWQRNCFINIVRVG